MPYTLISLGCASVIFLVGGLDRTPWRYSSVADHLQVILLTVLAILFALVLTFALNRLEPVARSLPVFQAALIVCTLLAARSIARIWRTRQIHNNGNGHVNEQPHETVLVVGVNAVAELFLLSVKEFASQRVQVAGVLAEDSGLRGRAIQQKPVLGTVEELQDSFAIARGARSNGRQDSCCNPCKSIATSCLEILLEFENSSNIVVQFLSERLGFEGASQKQSVRSGLERNSGAEQRAVSRAASVIDVNQNSAPKSFRVGKRIVDIFGATLLVLTLTPVAIASRLYSRIGCRISRNILAATTRSIWTAVQAIQISDNACAS